MIPRNETRIDRQDNLVTEPNNYKVIIKKIIASPSEYYMMNSSKILIHPCNIIIKNLDTKTSKSSSIGILLRSSLICKFAPKPFLEKTRYGGTFLPYINFHSSQSFNNSRV